MVPYYYFLKFLAANSIRRAQTLVGPRPDQLLIWWTNEWARRRRDATRAGSKSTRLGPEKERAKSQNILQLEEENQSETNTAQTLLFGFVSEELFLESRFAPHTRL